MVRSSRDLPALTSIIIGAMLEFLESLATATITKKKK